MRQVPISLDPGFATLQHTTFLYINDEIINNKINKNDFKIKTEYNLNNKLVNRNVKSSYGSYVDLAKLQHPLYTRRSKSNLLKVTTSATTTTTTTTTTNKIIQSSTINNIKPNIISPNKNGDKDIRKTNENDIKNTDKERNFQTEKRYAKFGRDINEKFIENVQFMDSIQNNNVSI